MTESTPPTVSGERLRTQRLVALVLLGGLALNYPLLAVFTDSSLFLGIPVFYLYLFVAWGAFILLCALLLAPRTPSSQVPAQRRYGGGSR